MFFSVALRGRHASPPACPVHVFIDRDQTRVSYRDHSLSVPMPETWTLDTVRAVLEALRRYLPGHEPHEVHARVQVSGPQRRRRAVLTVSLRDLEAIVYVPALNADFTEDADALRFSAPMVAALKTLQGRGVFALAALQPVPAVIAAVEETDRTVDSATLIDLLRRLPAEKRAALATLLRASLEQDRDDDEA